jgi:ATP-dependent protease ClpP protease subunit
MTETNNPPFPMSEALEAAYIAKLQAETVALGLDKQIKEAEARQKVAHAISAEHGMEAMRIQTEATQRQEKLVLASDHHHHLYRFTSPVYMESVDECLAQLAIWDRLDPSCDMTIEFDSPGGDIIAGNHLFDQIVVYSKRPWDTTFDSPRGNHRTVGVIRGWAASMAGVLVQAFDERIAGPTATVMIHEAATWAKGKISTIKDEIKFLDQLDETSTDWFMARVNAAKAANPGIEGISRESFVEQYHRKEWYVSAKDAVNLGLVDRIG